MELVQKLFTKSKLINFDFALLIQGHFVSKLGTYIFDIAMILWIKENTDYAGFIGLILIVAHLPEIILAPIGGVCSDLISKKKIIVISDLIGGLTLILCGTLITTANLSKNYLLLVLFAAAATLGTLNSFFNPAVSSFIPQLVKADNLQKANSYYNLSTNAGKLIGQSTSGILFKLLSLPFLFFINGISFIFSAVSEMFIKEKSVITSLEKAERKSFNQFKQMISEGFNHIRDNKALKRLIMLVAVFHFFVSPIPILIPYYISDTLNYGFEWIGIVLFTFTIGIIAGFALSRKIVFNRANIKSNLMKILLTATLNFLLIGVMQNVLSPILNLFSLGIVIGILVVNLQTIIQTNTPPEIQGRVFGFFGTLINITFPLGFGIYALLIDQIIAAFSIKEVAPAIFFINGISLLLFIFFIIKVNFKELFSKQEIKDS